MSIAVCAVVAPSRKLRVLLAAFGLSNVAAAFTVGVWLPERFVLPVPAAVFFLVAAAFLMHSCATATKTRRIDISGVGTLRLTVQQDMGADRAIPVQERPAGGFQATLLAGSTLWPQLLLLRLGTQAGTVLLLPVLRDSVAPGTFRALAVAVGALGGGNKPLQGKHKIL
jgi:toxin CptA